MEQLTTRAALLNTVRALRAEIERVIAGVDETRAQQAGSFDELSFKDVVAHLTGWRQTSVARLEAGLRGEQPAFPWPSNLNEDDDTDEINRWFFKANHDKSYAEVIRESGETFDRVESAIAELPQDDLFTRDRFDWLQGYTLGPDVVQGMLEHYRIDHEPEILAWLGQR